MRRERRFHVPAVWGALALVWLWSAPARADLSKAMAEPDLEKRSGLALANAAAAFETARAAYDKGDNAQVAAAAAEIQESVDLAAASLKQTGKNARKHPKWFKKAEIESRDLLRKLDAFQQAMGYSDRAMLGQVTARVQKVHDEWLDELLEGGK
ncbi:MAG: hypothetical protein ABSC23_09355 [Bryobacteraceae bacterium]|jgi:hypothetical protein